MMKTLHQLLLAILTALLLSELRCTYCPPTLSDFLCGISGYECKKSSECCEKHCCVRGVCEEVRESASSSTDSQGTCDPCNEIVCEKNQTCQVVKDPNCANEPCKEVPRCFPFIACNVVCKVGYQCVIDYSTNPPAPKCIPKVNPCNNVVCSEFQQCYLESPNCLVDPQQPVPVCAYGNPCDFVSCPNDTICSTIQENNAPPKAQCVKQFDECYGVQCPDYQKCYLIDVQCVRAPCLPVPECAYYNPCMFTKCSPYHVCKLFQEGTNPPISRCELDYESFCAGAVCPESQKCYLKPETLSTPFPPETVCDYYNPCMLARCAGGYSCITVDNGYYPPALKCVPSRESVCEGTVCMEDQKCYLQDVSCETEPCLPQPQCAHENPCILINCATGYSCTVDDHGDYPPTPKCVFNPKTICLLHKCPSYQKCYLMDVICVSPPCSPEPVCSYPDPCLFAYCGEGYKCVVVEEKPKPPTAYCLHTYDLCVGVICKPGYACFIKDVECTDFECFSIPATAVCALPNPCEGHQCPPNSDCVTAPRQRNNPPEAKCVAVESPCDNILCESYELCYIKDYECDETTCNGITPVGECALPDPCIAAQCSRNTVCQALQIRRNPPQPVCGPVQIYSPCDEFQCDQGFQCYVRDVECTEFGCVAVVPQPVCSQPDPCVSALCAEGTICVPVHTRNNPPVAQCKPLQSLCESTECDPGQQCYVRDYECGELGCNRLAKPYPTCALDNPCDITLCAEFSICNILQIRDNPPQPVCVSIPSADVCESVCNKSGYACYIKDTKCDEFYCLPIEPEPICALINPCSVVRCTENAICVEKYERNNPPKAVCQKINPCHNVNCSSGDRCYIKDFECNENGCVYVEPRAVCAYTDPCTVTMCDFDSTCFVQQIRENPPFAICGPDSKPCSAVDCPLGDLCYVKDFECDTYSCRSIKPKSVCAPADPCDKILCPDRSVCIPSQIRSNPPQGYCISNKELCTRRHCANGEKCYVIPVSCIRAPCPPQPICFPADPCGSSTCLSGYKCVNRQYGDNPPFAECVLLDDPCDGVNCSDSQECYLKEKSCLCPPCGHEAVCAHPNPCIAAQCSEGHGCYAKTVGRLEPIPVCYPTDNPCEVFECLPGQQCTTETSKTGLPCPTAVCTGDPTNYLCRLARCSTGYKCVVDLDFKPLIAKCVPYDPCEYTVCPEGSSCVVLNTYPPVAQCQNATDTKPCSVVWCKSGYQCEETDADPVQAVCVATCLTCPPNTDCVVIYTEPPMIRCNPHPKWLITHATL